MAVLAIGIGVEGISTEPEACDMLIAIDEPLYAYANSFINRDFKNLTELVHHHVKQLNEIYQQ